ncbi:hypothetical protein [Streptomyces sp. NPDC002104]
MQKPPSQPELPDRVPEKRDAVTPDLPPLGPGAPDLPAAERGGTRHDDQVQGGGEENDGVGSEATEGEELPAGPGNAKPQEPTG